MGYDPQTCYNKLQDAGFVPPCDQIPGNLTYHCQYVNDQYHQLCNQQGVYWPIQTAVCVNKDGKAHYFPPDTAMQDCFQLAMSDPAGKWNMKTCYCCCSCFAYGTLIAIPRGVKSIQEIAKGEEVLAASATKAGTKTQLTWKPAKVTFSEGVGGGYNPAMVYLAFGDSQKTGDFICSTDQVFMLANGKLITAEKLKLGDQLMDREGNPVPLQTVAIGSYKGGVHHISTNTPQNLDINGHLILAGGVVAGDYHLQLHFPQLPPELKAGDLGKRASLGSEDYEKRHKSLKAKASLHFGKVCQQGAHRMKTQSGGLFTVYNAASSLVGEDSVSWLTSSQSLDLLKNGTQLPVSNTLPKGSVDNIFKILTGFYPDYIFHLDWYQMLPNVHAMERFGRKVVVITGGLARMAGFQYEGMAMAIAHAVARFFDDKPQGVHGFSGTGTADYAAFGTISRSLWYGNHWLDYVMPAYQQTSALFNLISPENAAGNPLDPVNQPSIACRLGAMSSAIGGGALPECAGGPIKPRIGLQAVTATTTQVTLTLTLAPLPDSATNVQNYSIPGAVITSAKPDATRDFIIYLETTLEQGQSYQVTIQNMTSVIGSGVDPNHNTMTFTVE